MILGPRHEAVFEAFDRIFIIAAQSRAIIMIESKPPGGGSLPSDASGKRRMSGLGTTRFALATIALIAGLAGCEQAPAPPAPASTGPAPAPAPPPTAGKDAGKKFMNIKDRAGKTP